MSSIEDNYSIDDLGHCAFAASIRSDQRDDFARMHIQISIGERHNTAIALDNVSGRKQLSHVLLLEVLADNLSVAQDVIEQVGIGLAFAHRQAFIEVLGGDDRRQGQDE